MVRPVETRPSGAHRWTRCSAAPQFASRVPVQPSGDEAREGTCAAWVAELVLQGKVFRCADLIGERHENDWEVDAEMAGFCQDYVDMIRSDGGFISAERFVRLSDRVAGTLDNAAAFSDGIVKVRDLKYGFRLIEADATQLVIYAGALVAEMLEQGQPVREVWTEIYQPRGFHPDGIHRRKRWTVDEIWRQCQWIAARAEECHKPNPIATPGPWCLNCEGATGCAALAATSANTVALVEDHRHREMTSQEMAERLRFIREAKKIIDAAASAVEAEALARHTSGDPIPGWGLKERQGHAKLTASPEAIKALTGVTAVKEVPMSPAELKAAGVTARQMKMFSHRPTIGHKLEPLDAADLARQFGKD